MYSYCIMNTQQKLQYTKKRLDLVVLDVDFNTDGSCFAIGGETGVSVFKLDPIEPITIRTFNSHIKSKKTNRYQVIDQGMDLVDMKELNDTQVPSLINGKGVGLVKMLLKTNYMLLVGGGKDPIAPINKVIVWDDAKMKPTLIFELPTPVLNCGISKKHLVIVLKSQVMVYSFSLQPQLISHFDTIDNDDGVLDVLLTDDVVKVAFPARTIGQIQILELQTNSTSPGSTVIVKAHLARIQLIKISRNGRLMASASETGTLIRVHDAKTSALVFEFRRGVDKAKITSMTFSRDDSLLAVLSDKNTLHVFKLKPNGMKSNKVIGDNKTHSLNMVPLIPLPAYFHSKWSFVSGGVGSDTFDIGKIGWVDDMNIVIIWKIRGIWEKWSIVSDGETQHLVKNGWKGLLTQL